MDAITFTEVEKMKGEIRRAIPLVSIFFLVSIFLCMLFSGCYESGGTIRAELLTTPPESFINISEQQIQQFPHLKQAFNQTDTFIEPPADEWNKLREFFGDFYAYIYYQGEYYYVRLFGII